MSVNTDDERVEARSIVHTCRHRQLQTTSLWVAQHGVRAEICRREDRCPPPRGSWTCSVHLHLVAVSPVQQVDNSPAHSCGLSAPPCHVSVIAAIFSLEALIHVETAADLFATDCALNSPDAHWMTDRFTLHGTNTSTAIVIHCGC